MLDHLCLLSNCDTAIYRCWALSVWPDNPSSWRCLNLFFYYFGWISIFRDSLSLASPVNHHINHSRRYLLASWWLLEQSKLGIYGFGIIRTCLMAWIAAQKSSQRRRYSTFILPLFCFFSAVIDVMCSNVVAHRVPGLWFLLSGGWL